MDLSVTLRSEGFRVAAVAGALALCTLALSWPVADLGVPRASDRNQYESVAFNLVRHGEFHDFDPEERLRKRDVAYSRREPGYSLYLAAVFALSPEFDSLSHACLLDPACEAADPLRRRVWGLTFLLGAGAVALTFVTTFLLTASWTVSIAAGGLGMLLIPPLLARDIPSFLAGVFLLTHATLAAHAWRKPRMATGLLSGVALGLLVLTKAVFQYWLAGAALALAAGLWLDADRRRTLAPACAALLLGACLLTLPWMVRNAVQAGQFGISGRDGELLAIRAEYGRMTWPELRGAFAFYLPNLPVVGDRARSLALRWLEPETFGYTRFDRDNPDGFYGRAKDDTGDVAARADLIDPEWRASQASKDAALKQAAVDLMRTDWPKQAALTLVFAERGARVSVGSCRTLTDPAHKRFGWAIGWPMGHACNLARIWAVVLIPIAGVLLVLAWRRRSIALGLVLLPIVYGFGIHALATHFIERYSRPLIPLLVVVAALVANELAPRADRAAVRLGSLASDAARRRLRVGGRHPSAT